MTLLNTCVENGFVGFSEQEACSLTTDILLKQLLKGDTQDQKESKQDPEEKTCGQSPTEDDVEASVCP